jgi:uncharacterized protein involved in outer membrane biogenesis
VLSKRLILFVLFVAGALLFATTQVDRLLKLIVIQQLETALAAEVSIDGEIELDLGATTSLSLHQIRIKRPNQLVKAEHFYLEVVSRSIVSDQVSFPTVRIRDLAINMEGAIEEQTTELTLDGVLDQLNQSHLMLENAPIDIQQISLHRGRLRYVDADQNITLSLQTGGLTVARRQRYELHAFGLLNQSELQLNAVLTRSGYGTGLKMKSRWANYDIDLEGNVESISPLKNLDVALNVKGPSAKPLLNLIGAQEVRDGQLSINSRVRDENDAYTWTTNGEIGALKVSTELTHSLRNSDFHLDFTASGPSLKEAGALVDYLDYSELPFDTSGTVTRQGSILTLEKSRINLGDGIFLAEGILPMFPAWDDWQLGIEATSFDLNILQPFSPCRLPSLPMDWQGEFSSSGNGLETFALDFRNPDQSIRVNGQLGAYPNSIDSEIKILSSGLDLNTLSQCAGINLDKAYPSDISLVISKGESQWQVNDLSVATTLISANGNLSIESSGELTGRMQVNTNDVRSAATALGLDETRIQPIPASFDFNLASNGNDFRLNNGIFLVGENHKGDFNFALKTGGETLDFDASATLTTPDLSGLFTQIPDIAQDQPVRIKTRWSSNGTDHVKADVQLSIDKNRIKATAVLPTGREFKNSSINFEGQGPNIAQVLAPFVTYPLPSIPYDAAFTLRVNGSNLQIDNLLVEAGEQQLSGQLSLDLEQSTIRTHGNLLLKGNSSNTLMQLFGFQTNFLDRSYELALDVDENNENVYLRILRAQLGESDVSGEIVIKPGDVFTYNVNLTSERIHLPVFVPSLITATDDKKDPVKDKARVIPLTELSWDWLSRINLNFSHEAKVVDLQPGSHSHTQLDFSIGDGRLSSQNISWRSNLSDGLAVVLIEQDALDPTIADIKLEVSSERIPMLWLFTGSPISVDGERLQFNAKVESRGSDTLSILKNLDGLIAFRGGGGVINSGKLDTLFGDFLFQLTKNVFRTAEKQTNISCTSGGFTIKKGKVNLYPGLAVRSSRFDIFTTGEIDLPSESLKLQLNSRSRQGIGISAASSLVPRVRIGGTLAKPQVQISATETALSGSAAIASSGLTILASGLWDRIRSSAGNPCDTVYDRALNDEKLGYGALVNGPDLSIKKPK